MNFSITVEGSLEVRKALQDLGARATPAMRAALSDEANSLLNEADALVPRDTENLAGSKFQLMSVNQAKTDITVGYGGAAALYAIAVHENPRSGKTGGLSPSGAKYKHWAGVGQWKYLETPFKARMYQFSSRIAESLRQTLMRPS